MAPAAGPHLAMYLGASQIASRERLFLDAGAALAAEGWRVTFLTAKPIPALRAAVTSPMRLVDVGRIGPFPMPRLLPHLARLYASTPAVAGFLREARPDVLMGTSIPPNLIMLQARRMAKLDAPVILRQSNVVPIAADPASRHAARRLRDRLMPRLYPDAAAVIGVSEGVAHNLLAAGWLPPDRIHAIPNGVDLAAAEAQAAAPVDHPWLQGDGGGPVIVAVGRLIVKKDYPTLLRAFAGLEGERPARLIVLGEGRERPKLEALVKQLGLEGRVDLFGRTPNPFAFLARADLFVLSSRFEGMPSVVIEALACGCPAVSTDCPSGPSEILGGGAYGPLTPVGDVEALRGAMIERLAAPRDAERLKARAAEFSAARTVSRYADLIKSLAPAPAGQVIPDIAPSPARP